MKKNCLENQEEGGVRTPEPEGTRPKRVAFDHFATSPPHDSLSLFLYLSLSLSLPSLSEISSLHFSAFSFSSPIAYEPTTLPLSYIAFPKKKKMVAMVSFDLTACG